MKKSLSLVVLVATSFICSMDQDPQSPRSAPTSPRLTPDFITRRTSASPSTNPALVRTKRQSFETLPPQVNKVNMAETIRKRSVGSEQPVQHMDPTTAAKTFDDKRGRPEDKK